MNTCPKCNCGIIVGPRYESGTGIGPYWISDRLRYTCTRCGYIHYTQCHDAVSAAEPRSDDTGTQQRSATE